MSALVFMDTETTGLALDDEIWEFAAIRREEDGTETSLHLFIAHDGRKCRRLPEPFLRDHMWRFPGHGLATGTFEAAERIYNFLRGGDGEPKPHIVGAVPSFDTERLAPLLASVTSAPMPWHHHLIDVETLALGWMAAAHRPVPLPWDSDALSRSVGVEPPTERRHTAMGDAEWVRAIYDAVMGDVR